LILLVISLRAKCGLKKNKTYLCGEYLIEIMIERLIKRYESLENDARTVVNFLALNCDSMMMSEIARMLPNIKMKRLNEIIKQEINSGLIVDNYSYYNEYVTNMSMVVWLFPLISNKAEDIYEKSGRRYYQRPHVCMLNYLKALCYVPNKLPEAEKSIISDSSEFVSHLLIIFSQPAYDGHIHRISNQMIALLYSAVFSETTDNLTSFELLERIDSRFHDNNSEQLNYYRAKVALVHGDFEQARNYVASYDDEPLKYFVEAIIAVINDEMDNALLLFEKGMKKQRRIYKNRFLPVIPEVSIFYLSACLSKGQDFYSPVFQKITNEKVSSLTNVYIYFRKACEYCISNIEWSEKIFAYIVDRNDNPPAQVLWKAVAAGLVGKSLDKKIVRTEIVRQAFENRHYLLAYETVFLLAKWSSDDEYRQLFEDIAAKLKYQPALSLVKHPAAWEKQLNAYFSLGAVQAVIQRETENNKTRVAYCFFPKYNYAIPILQTRNAAGVWSAGRNIAISTFADLKVDCMTEQDRRIAAANSSSYHLELPAIAEMVGHPYVFLENSNILVELFAAQPVLSVVKSSGKTCRIKCDIKNPDTGVMILKETNTRYRVYNLTVSQCEIIDAVSKSVPVPEEGYEKLMRLLQHFSAHVQVHSDLVVNEDDAQLRQVSPDSRIHVQLLPIGDGLKAELFVKPFGTHPPYCKPGRGGKSLIATENGERVRVTRNLDDEKAFNERILDDIRTLESAADDDGLMVFDNPFDALELLDVLDRHQDVSVVEWPEGERLKIRKKVAFDDLNLRMNSAKDWFELEGELKIDENTVLTLGRLLEMVRNGHGRFVELSNGEFLALSEQLRRRLSELASFASESKKSVVINRFASASMLDSFDEFKNFSVDKAWRDFRKRLQTVQLSNASVPSLLQTELRPYQLSGYQWMIRLSEWGAGACLADDMGLGKTVQAIAVLLQRAHVGAAMVVSPVSVMPNWISEVNRFAPTLNVKTLRNSDREATLASLEPGDLLVTSYGLLLSEEQAISAIRWATVILDEAHAIKNYNTKTSKAAMSLQSDFRVILTGTPIQNHLGEIWNLFQFINPGLLGSLAHFNTTFIRPDDEKSRKRLKKLITPFILRRTKTAVLEELPPKTEIIRKITLSDEEVAFYEMLRRQAIESLEHDDSPQGAKHLKVLAEITRLRQACCNPSLVYPNITIESTKLSTFLEIASELKDNGHRALVFSQFVTHLSIVRKALEKVGYTYCYLDGSTSSNKREAEVRRFQNGQVDFFLISLKAGGLGLNLTAADYVIHLDPWWNPAIEDQASDRAHRIGQNRPVTVYRLVAEQTIEEKIIRLHNTKRDLADSLLEGSDQSAKLSINELMALIKE
jgi:SNF2 family DNA or RNA helicase